MRPAYLISCLLAAAVTLVDVAHSAPAAIEEMHTDSGAAAAPAQPASHAPECVAPERACWPHPGAAAPANLFQPGAIPSAARLAPAVASPAILARAAPHGSPPFSILFRNFRS
jgi:hypothetical protein